MIAGRTLVLAAVAAAIAVPLIDGGGLTERSRALFAALAGLAAAVALLTDERAEVQEAQEPG